jgi:hypothetical protein
MQNLTQFNQEEKPGGRESGLTRRNVIAPIARCRDPERGIAP